MVFIVRVGKSTFFLKIFKTSTFWGALRGYKDFYAFTFHTGICDGAVMKFNYFSFPRLADITMNTRLFLFLINVRRNKIYSIFDVRPTLLVKSIH